MSHNYEAMAAEIDRRLNDPAGRRWICARNRTALPSCAPPSRASARCPLIPRIGCSTFLRMSIAWRNQRTREIERIHIAVDVVREFPA